MQPPRFEADVVIVGAGPAGSTLGARLAQLGHRVLLIERVRFPRRRLGESLSPGVLSLLAVTGADASLGAARPARVQLVELEWGRGREQRQDPAGRGLLVDRGPFDAMLLAHARSLGAKVVQPATVRSHRYENRAWRVRIDAPRGPVELCAPLLVDATGRSGAFTPRRRRTGAPTLALFRYCRGRGLPEHPAIRAFGEQWAWGVPLPGGSYNALVFVDRDRLRRLPREPAPALFQRLLDQARLLDGALGVEAASEVYATDATPYLDETLAKPGFLRVGDAALALDPISSSGVQKAIQTALAAAVVANTLLRRPGSTLAALAFYTGSLRRSSEQHARWAAGYYAEVARTNDAPFWANRAAPALSSQDAEPAPIGVSASTPLALSRQVEWVRVPCIDSEFVSEKDAVRHPGLEEPIAFLDGCELAPLLQRVPPSATRHALAENWSSRVPFDRALTLVDWLTARGVLVAANAET